MFKRIRIDVSELLGESDTPDESREWIDITEVMWLPNNVAFALQRLAGDMDQNDPSAIEMVAKEVMSKCVIDWHLLTMDDDGSIKPMPKPRELKSRNDGSFNSALANLPLMILLEVQNKAFAQDGEVPLEKSTSSEVITEPAPNIGALSVVQGSNPPYPTG